MQILVSAGVIASGLVLVLFLAGTAEERIFGTIIAGIGMLALVFQLWLARQGDRQPPRR